MRLSLASVVYIFILHGIKQHQKVAVTLVSKVLKCRVWSSSKVRELHVLFIQREYRGDDKYGRFSDSNFSSR